MGRVGQIRGDSGFGNVAHIAVALELAPHPITGDLECHKPFAEKGLGGLHGGCRGFPVQGCNGHNHFHGHAFNKFFGVDAALQFHIGKIGAKGMQPGIEISHHRFFEFLPIRSAKRSRYNAPFTVRWTRTLRRSAVSRRRATRSSLPMESRARVTTGFETLKLFGEIADRMGRGFHIDGQQDAHLPRRKIGLSAMHLGKADIVPKFEGLRGSQRN